MEKKEAIREWCFVSALQLVETLHKIVEAKLELTAPLGSGTDAILNIARKIEKYVNQG